MASFDKRGQAFYKRSVAALGAGAISLGAVVALAPSASADVQDLQAACEGWTDDVGFTDIGTLNPETQAAINCLAQYGVTQGRSETSYAPRDAVDRYEMAIFLTRVLAYIELAATAEVTFDADVTDAGFDDLGAVPEEGVVAINILANLGIAQGKSADTYDPFAPVTRRDMASFVNRVQGALAQQVDGAAYNPDNASQEFDDVPATLERADDIYALEAAGIVQGTGVNTYNPYAATLRSEMAFFLMRHLNENIVAERLLSGPELVDETAPTFTVAPATAGDTTVVFTAGEEIDDTTVAAEDITETSAAGISDVTVGDDLLTITVTFDAPLEADDVVTLEAGSVDDLAGNPGPAADVSVTVSGDATTAPDPATITLPDVNPLYVNRDSYNITGTAQAGATVRLFDAGDAEVDSGTVAADGTFTLTAPLTQNAANEFAVVVEDAAGNTSVETALTIIEDSARPDVESITGPDGAALADGQTTVVVTFDENVSNRSISLADFTVGGLALPAETQIELTVDEATDNQLATLTLTAPLVEGEAVVVLADSVEDRAGNVGPAVAFDAIVGAAPAQQ